MHIGSYLFLIIIVSQSTNAYGEMIYQEKNSTDSNFNKVIIQLENIDKSLNDMNEKIAESSYVNLVLILISILIAGIASISAYGTAYFSRKQLEQAEKDLRMRFSPRVIVDGPRPSQVVLKDSSVLLYNTFAEQKDVSWKNVDYVIFKIPFKNIGGDVALNVSHIKLVNEEEFTSTEFEGKPDINLNLILAPNQEFFVTFNVDFERFDILETKLLYAGLSLKYEDFAGKNLYVGAIYGIRRGGNFVSSSWMTNPF